MKLHHSLNLQTANKLYFGEYRYKLTVLGYGAIKFENIHNYPTPASFKYLEVCFGKYTTMWQYENGAYQDDREFLLKFSQALSKCSPDYMVEHDVKFLSLYSNNVETIETLANVEPSHVCEVFKVHDSITEPNTIYLPGINFKYKVTVQVIRKNRVEFKNWASNTKSIHLTDHIIEKLSKENSFGASYFYASSDSALTMAKLLLVDGIIEVDTIIN